MLAKDVIGPVAERLGVASPMKYSDIIGLDRRAREFYVEQYRHPAVDPMDGQVNVMDMIQKVTSTIQLDMRKLHSHI